MPWLTIIMTLLSFFMSKKKGASNTEALITAGLVGAGTYWVTHETDWGKANLGHLDGVPATEPGTPLKDKEGNPVLDAKTGQPILVPTGTPGGTSVLDVLKDWGATGTAAVIGTAAIGSSSTLQKLLPWGIGLAALFFLTRA